MAEDAAKPRRKIGLGALAIGLIILAAVGFIAYNALGDQQSALVDTSNGKSFPCTVQSVYDGDGPINCYERDTAGNQVILRIRGIEARETDNRCPRANLCPQASGAEAKAVMERLAVGRLQCVSFGPSYNRIDAHCTNPSGQDLSCEMLRSGTAVHWPEYDPEGALVQCVRPYRGGAARQ